MEEHYNDDLIKTSLFEFWFCGGGSKVYQVVMSNTMIISHHVPLKL